MTKIKYWIFVALVFLLAIVTTIVAGAKLVSLLDPAPFLFLITLWLLPTVFIVGFKKTKIYHSDVFSVGKTNITEEAIAYFHFMTRFIMYGAIVASLLFITFMMIFVDDGTIVGHRTVNAIFIIIYSCLFVMVTSVPFQFILKRKLSK